MRSFARVFGLAVVAAGLSFAQASTANAGCLGFSGTADGFDQETGVSRAQLALSDAIADYKKQKRLGSHHRHRHARKAAALLARQRVGRTLLQTGHREIELLHDLLAWRGFALCLHFGRQSLLVIR